jgi:hypothetical protein
VQQVNSELAIHVLRNVSLILSDRVPEPDGGVEWGQAAARYSTPLLCRGRRDYLSFVAYGGIMTQGYDASHMTTNLT